MSSRSSQIHSDYGEIGCSTEGTCVEVTAFAVESTGWSTDSMAVEPAEALIYPLRSS